MCLRGLIVLCFMGFGGFAVFYVLFFIVAFCRRFDRLSV